MYAQLESDDRPIPFRTRDVPGPTSRLLMWLMQRHPLVITRDGSVYVDTGTYDDGFRVYRKDYRSLSLPVDA